MEVTLNEVRRKSEPSTVKDGKHHILNCSNCLAPLVDIWETSKMEKPKEPWLIKASCAHCGDCSAVVEVYSTTYHVGTIAEDDNNNPYTLLKNQTTTVNRENKLVFVYETSVNKKWGLE